MTPKQWENQGEGAAQRLAGKPVAEQMLEGVRRRVAALPKPAGLALICVGDDEASQSYVRSKDKKATSLGMSSTVYALPASTTQAELMALIARLNVDADTHGILLQLPLPEHLHEEPALLAIDPLKDVDGFHPMNAAKMWAGQAEMPPCTPQGILELLDFYGVPLEGRRATVVGRSELVGRPMTAMLLGRNATVTVAHSRTTDLAEATRSADVVVVAAGQPDLITADMVKAGAVVVDVGINYLDNSDGGPSMVGDVAKGVEQVAGGLTPVPSGVGPLTIAQLMVNAVRAAELQQVQAEADA